MYSNPENNKSMFDSVYGMLQHVGTKLKLLVEDTKFWFLWHLSLLIVGVWAQDTRLTESLTDQHALVWTVHWGRGATRLTTLLHLSKRASYGHEVSKSYFEEGIWNTYCNCLHPIHRHNRQFYHIYNILVGSTTDSTHTAYKKSRWLGKVVVLKSEKRNINQSIIRVKNNDTDTKINLRQGCNSSSPFSQSLW